MSTTRCNWLPGAALGMLLLSNTGCGRPEAPAVAPMAAEEVPAKMEEAFAGAPAEARQAAVSLSGELESKPADAFFGFQELSYRSDLTPEQRTALAQAMLAARARLEAAAAGGDANARQALEQQAARK
jgi:hypothetical protein